MFEGLGLGLFGLLEREHFIAFDGDRHECIREI